MDDWKRDLCQLEFKDEPVYGNSESKWTLFLPPSAFSGTVHVSRALSSRLISSSTFARSQVFSLIFPVMTSFTSGGSFLILGCAI